MKATLKQFTKSNQPVKCVTVKKIGGSDDSIIYSVRNIFGFFTVEIDGRYDTAKKSMVAVRMAKVTTPLNQKLTV